MGTLVRFEDLTLGYDRHPAVHHLQGEIADGSLMAICGPNGAGKSTLLKGIAGVVAPFGGAIVWPAKKPPRIAYLPQSADIDRSFPINVFDMVAMGIWTRSGPFGGIGRAHRRIDAAIAAVGLAGFETRQIGTLSGGQLQRMLFARLLLQDAQLILLDEPFTALDAKTTTDLIDLVARWHGERRTVLAVLHDFDLVRRHFPETLLIAREKIAWDATDRVLQPDNLQRAAAMIEAFAHHAPACERVA
jgi:zinc/manganese transport system ATP-binding protein